MTKRKTIDELFREGLDGKGLSYDPKFWEAAQAGMPAIGKSSATGKRRRLALLALLFLFSGSVLFWLGYKLNGSDAGNSTVKTETALSTSPSNSPEQASVQPDANEISPLVQMDASSDPISLETSSQPAVATSILSPTPMRSSSADPSASEENRATTANPIVSTPRAFEALQLRSRFGLSFGSGAILSHSASTLGTQKNTFSYKPNAWAWYLAPEMGITSVQRELPGNEANALKQSEQVLNSSHLGLHLRAKKGHWTLSAGIGNLNVREAHNYSEEQTKWQYDTSVVLVRPYYTETKRGTRVALLERMIDSSSTTSTTVPCPDCETQFRYLRIPVSIQYEVGTGRLLGFGGLGLNYMRIISTEGSYAIPGAGDGVFTVQDELDNSTMRRDLFLWQAEAGLKYRLTHKWNVSGSMSMGASNQSIFESYTHRLSIRQVQIGLEYRLR